MLTNNAALPQSNGKAGRIHLSEATAELLRKHGKGRWLELREDKVRYARKRRRLIGTHWTPVAHASQLICTYPGPSKGEGIDADVLDPKHVLVFLQRRRFA
jgi:hypothetical protein